jgi:transcriptional regulator with XRE-family HTH domain
MAMGSRVRERREGLSLSQEDLAHRAGLSWGAVQRLESGRITDPHVSTLSGIARALGTTLEELTGDRPVAPLGEAIASLDNPRVVDWLQGKNASFVLLNDQEFEDVVVGQDLEDLSRLLGRLEDERQRVEGELQKTDVKKALFPADMRHPRGKEARLHEAMRPHRESAKLSTALAHEYTFRSRVIENYQTHLSQLQEEADEATRRLTLREELVGAAS